MTAEGVLTYPHVVARVNPDEDYQSQYAAVDGHLIAAAPDLLAACRHTEAFLDTHAATLFPLDEHGVILARSVLAHAIAKAGGRPL